jgi:hypothetical protein
VRAAPRFSLPVLGAVERAPDTSRRSGIVRAITLNPRRAAMGTLDAGAAAYPEDTSRHRPRTYADCQRRGLGDTKPCPYASCKHHLAVDVDPDRGSLKLNFPDREAHEAPSTCALRNAERGGMTLDDVGAAMNLTRERVRQLEVDALAKLARAARRMGVEGDLRAILSDALNRGDEHGAMLPAVDYAGPVRATEGRS